MLIAFDLDGTLIDSLGLTLDLFLDAALTLTGEKLRPEQVTRHYGHPEERMMDKIFPHDKKLAEEVFDLYVEGVRNEKDKVRLFENIAEGLTLLSQAIKDAHAREKNVSLALYTARGRKATEVLFEHLGLAIWFQNWVTGSDVIKGKPDPEGLHFLLRASGQTFAKGADNEDSLRGSYYVGDSAKDIVMAKAVGAFGVAVTWCQHCDQSELKAARPDFTFDEPRELFYFLIEKVRAL